GASAVLPPTRAPASCATSTSARRTRSSSAASVGARTPSPSGTTAVSSTAPCGTIGPRRARAIASPSRGTGRSERPERSDDRVLQALALNLAIRGAGNAFHLDDVECAELKAPEGAADALKEFLVAATRV